MPNVVQHLSGNLLKQLPFIFRRSTYLAQLLRLVYR